MDFGEGLGRDRTAENGGFESSSQAYFNGSIY